MYYDTLLISSVLPIAGMYGLAGPNFANFLQETPFFNGRTKKDGIAVSNVDDVGKFAADFMCHTVMVDILGDIDIPSAGGVCTLTAFQESMIQYGVLKLDFGQQTKLLRPIKDCPAGGGPYDGVKVRTQGVAGWTDSGRCYNGVPTSQARRMLPEPVFFEKGQAFALSIVIDNTPAAVNTLARIQALAALTGQFKVGIRITLEGKRGSPLMVGTPKY
jgi:hypothetical protein